MKRKWKIFWGVMIAGAIWALALPFWMESAYEDAIFEVAEEIEGEYEVAVVFGAGVNANGYPSHVLQDRLTAASELYHTGVVEKILVSGDNRFENYNEPEAMKIFLVNNLDVNEADIVEDFAGRRTYDTCARASQIWSLGKAVLVTQKYHLPRAMYLCEKWGIENIGYSADKREYRAQDWMDLRELIARNWAVLDYYILRPGFVGGEVETDFL